MDNKMEWADKLEAEKQEKNIEGYFKIVEGDNRIQLLSHLAPYALKWTGVRYEPAGEGDKNISHKGVGWVLQDGIIKSATLPYTVVRSIRELMKDQDYAFEEFPMPRQINIKAVGAGTKEVEYSVIPSPKELEVEPEVMEELLKKPTPEEMVEKLRKTERKEVSQEKTEYPEELKASDIPF